MLVPEELEAQLDALDELGRLSEAAIAERRHDDFATAIAGIRQVLAAIAWSLEGADDQTRAGAARRVVEFERENRRRQQMLTARRNDLGRQIARAKRARRMLAARLRARETRAAVVDIRR
ncbi:hypothetical protein EPN52_07795 [bacterium]|nr:MAG: hypothetical protein EPN52_07795 [bacterium]